jgi:hypothetical protein
MISTQPPGSDAPTGTGQDREDSPARLLEARLAEMTPEFVAAYQAVLSGRATPEQIKYVRKQPHLLDDAEREMIEGCLAVRREVRRVRAAGVRARRHEARLRVVTVRPRRGRERRPGTNARRRGSRRSAGAGGGGSGDDPDSDEPPGGRHQDDLTEAAA